MCCYIVFCTPCYLLFLGSNGTKWSNYTRYTGNNHELLSVCCANKRNPYSTKKRAISFWNKACLAFLLSIAFVAYNDPKNFAGEMLESLIIACIMTPYGHLLDFLAQCTYCHRENVCIKTARFCGSFALSLFFALSFVNIVGGIVILFCHEDGACSASQARSMSGFLVSFVFSLIFEQVLPLLTGSFNWIFYSWNGCLCCPVCKCYCSSFWGCLLCCLCTEEPNGADSDSSKSNNVVCVCPIKYSYCSLLTCFPIRKVLNVYNLAENTYDDDKKLFQEKYPGRVSIDDVSNVMQSDDDMSNNNTGSAQVHHEEKNPLSEV